MSKASYWNPKPAYNPRMANKGRALEELIKYQNQLYKARKVANIQKISTPWKVIRRGKDIVSAYPEEKSTLDFRGTVKGGQSVSFDAKESEIEQGLPLKHIEPHQVDYIRLALELSEKTFILCYIKPLDSHFIIDGAEVVQYWDRWQANKGKRRSMTTQRGCRVMPNMSTLFTVYLGYDSNNKPADKEKKQKIIEKLTSDRLTAEDYLRWTGTLKIDNPEAKKENDDE